MQMTELIPGLPEELGHECLTRLHYSTHRVASRVCRRWQDMLQSRDFYNHRKQSGRTHKPACLVQALPVQTRVDETKPAGPPVYGVSVFDPVSGSWDRVDPVPKYPHGLPPFCQVTACEGKLVLMGGWDPASYQPVRDVFVYEFTTQRWTRGKDMPETRSFFAAGEFNGRVYVAGGHDQNKNALKSARVYDVRENEWSELPGMSQERDECEGFVSGSEFWVVSGYGTDSQGGFVGCAEVYEIGSGIMKGYLNNAKATLSTIDEEGWLHTGDIVFFDEDGYLHLQDRMKDAIKYKGFQIAPADLEGVLINHPEILDVAVAGAMDEESGEVPVAFVVRKHISELNHDAVMDFVAAQVAP